MGSVAQNRPTTALLSKGSTGNPRTKAAAESAVRPAKEARRKSARQANRSPPRGSASPEIHTPKQRQRAFRFVESPESARQNSGFSVSKAVRRGSSNGMVLPGKSAEPAGACPAAAFSSGSHALGAGETRAAGVDNSTLRRIVGGTSERRIQRFEAGQAWLVQRNGSAGKERRASRSSSRGSVSPGKRASGVGKFRAAGVDNSTLRRIVGGTSEQRIQRFEVGQARFVQRKSFAGEERAEPAGACPAAAFRREAARWADDSTFRRIVGGAFEQRIQRFEAGQARFVQRKKFAGKPRAGAAAEGVPLRRIAG